MRSGIAVLLLLGIPASAFAQQNVANRPADTAARIANALAAAPAFITDKATILDWPASATAKPTVLRQGTNGWSCFPDFPQTEGNDPMCLDEVWVKFVDAQLKQQPPQPSRVGIGYMLGAGGAYGSSSDPTATAKTATNHWGHDGPHMMIIVPDTRSLVGLPTTRDSGGPYVMFAGTPYAHIMVPTRVSTPPRQD
jgi:hypothetical protein